MSTDAQAILAHLKHVEACRGERKTDASLAPRVDAIKQFQHARFARCYEDLLGHPRFAEAARFFLDDLYGPRDFSDRDAQFARVVPALVRLFPAKVVHTVRTLAELHALSERLDSDMARSLAKGSFVNATSYTVAWRATGNRELRFRQISLTLQIGASLERFTRNALLRHSLRMMRGPARAAGLSSLQDFLEHGFDAFRSMGAQASIFLDTIGDRERRLAGMLFDDPMVDELTRSQVAFPWPAPQPIRES